MFESMKQNGRLSGVVYITSLMVSLVVHAVIICLLVIVPLVFFNALQAQELLTFLVEPPPPPAQPPPSPPAKGANAGRPTKWATTYDSPTRIPKGIPPPDEINAEPFDPDDLLSAIPGMPGSPGQPGGSGRRMVDLLGGIDEPPVPPRPPVKPTPPVRVGILEQSKLIYKVNPVYPAIAVKAHITGTVILEAVVDEEGCVSTVKVLSGHPFLVNSAVQAVRQWRYSPTILNGEPVPVIATITVVFRLD